MLGLDLEKAGVVAVPRQMLLVGTPLNNSARFHDAVVRVDSL